MGIIISSLHNPSHDASDASVHIYVYYISAEAILLYTMQSLYSHMKQHDDKYIKLFCSCVCCCCVHRLFVGIDNITPGYIINYRKCLLGFDEIQYEIVLNRPMASTHCIISLVNALCWLFDSLCVSPCRLYI